MYNINKLAIILGGTFNRQSSTNTSGTREREREREKHSQYLGTQSGTLYNTLLFFF